MPKRSLKPKCGSRRAHLSASRTSIGCKTRMNRLAAACSTTPADRIRYTNEPDEPSRIGISAASMSMFRLSMPSPASADIRCSTVATRICCWPWCIAVSVDAIRVSLTASALAGMARGGSRSIRQNTIPLSAGAGRKPSRTRWPLCSPTPVVLTGSLSVRCLSISASFRLRQASSWRVLKGEDPRTVRVWQALPRHWKPQICRRPPD